jgi:hypothetical protein
MTGTSSPGTPTPGGPARAWATEHYGFPDDAPTVQPGAAAGRAANISRAPGEQRRPRIAARFAVGSVLALTLVAGAGGAALAAADGPGGGRGDGPDGFALFDDGRGGR